MNKAKRSFFSKFEGTLNQWVKDPRSTFLLFAIFFVWFSLRTISFGRNLGDFVLMACCFVVTDLILQFIFTDRFTLPVSGFISSIGTFLLADLTVWWMVPLLAFLAMGSKFMLRLNGGHIFNPNNFAIVLASLTLPDWIAPVGGIRWGGEIWLASLIFCMGFALVWRAQRAIVSLSYLTTFFIVGLIFRGLSLNNSFFTLLSPGVQLYIYFMISDPRTSPRRPLWQMIFGLSVAVFDHLMRLSQFRLAPFFSLFVITIVYAFLRPYEFSKVLIETKQPG